MATYGFDENKNKVEVYSKSEVYSKGEASSKTEMGSLSSLKTSNKSSVVAAVNECFQNASDGKSKLAAAIGNGATASMTWDQIASRLVVITQKTVASSLADKTGDFNRGFNIVTNWASGYKNNLVVCCRITGRDDSGANDDLTLNYIRNYYDDGITLSGINARVSYTSLWFNPNTVQFFFIGNN